jgi:hypothetical protein
MGMSNGNHETVFTFGVVWHIWGEKSEEKLKSGGMDGPHTVQLSSCITYQFVIGICNITRVWNLVTFERSAEEVTGPCLRNIK